MSRVVVVLGVLALGVCSAGADQLWYTYEGNDYPEVEGPWIRYTRGGGAQRSLQDGVLVLDSLADWQIVDEYYINTPFVLDPGESLRVEWSVRIDQTPTDFDAAVAVRAGVDGVVLLHYTENRIWSDYEGVWIDFVPGVFHDYSLISYDLAAYSLYIDGQLAHSGYLQGAWPSSGFTWGDLTEGATSMTSWDYVRFGIVPEPASGLMLGLVGLGAVSLAGPKTRRSRRCHRKGRVVQAS
jgi:hypothetical protein